MTDSDSHLTTGVSAPLLLIADDVILTYSHYPREGWPHTFRFANAKTGHAATVAFTTDALVALQNRINTVLDDPAEVAAWAARDLAGLALREAMGIS